MITEHLAVIRHEDDDGIISLTTIVERLEDAPYLIIDELAHGVVGCGDFTMIFFAQRRGVKFPGIVMCPFMIQLLESGFF